MVEPRWADRDVSLAPHEVDGPRVGEQLYLEAGMALTLFDPRSVAGAVRSVVGEGAEELCEAWRARQFQYAFLRAAGGRYTDFRQVTDDALVFAAKARGLSLSTTERRRLVRACSELELWPDTRTRLAAFKDAGLLLAPLTNYAPSMLAELLENAHLTDVFDACISTDAARTFKPDSRAYALGVSVLGRPREQIAFSAFGGWDAAGARWFGYPTFWVNRLGTPLEELARRPAAHLDVSLARPRRSSGTSTCRRGSSGWRARRRRPDRPDPRD